MLVVITILGILASIAVITVVGSIDNTEEGVCKVNVREVEKHYEAHLVFEGISSSDAYFGSTCLIMMEVFVRVD